MSKFAFSKLSDFAQWAFELRGDPFSLKDREYLLPIYSAIQHPDIKHIVLKFGRQTEKCLTPDSFILSDVGLPIKIMYLEEASIPITSWNSESPRHTHEYIFHENGVGRVYNVITETGKTLKCSASHLLFCKEDLGSNPEWVPAIVSKGMFVAEPFSSWKFLNNNSEPYPFPTPYIFGLNESRSIETAEMIGSKGSVDFKTEKEAKYYQIFLSKLGILSIKHRNSIDIIGPIKEKIKWTKILEVNKKSYSEWVDLEFLNGCNAYTAEGMIVHNSTTLASTLLAYGALVPNTNTLIINPAEINMRYFSRERLDPFIKSERFQKTCISPKDDQAIGAKQLANNSKIFLRAAYTTADRSRGISSDILMIDEVQDIRAENVNIISETLSHSQLGKTIMAGTPKTFDNVLEDYWLKSRQYEYIISCPGCNKHNCLDERNIADQGLVCQKCRKLLDQSSGRWVAMSPSSNIWGFRFPQIASSWIKWDDILYKQSTYQKQQFFNEVLALACDIGLTAIPSQFVIQACDPKFKENWDKPPEKYRSRDFFIGIDWGTREYGSTVVSVLMRDKEFYRVVHARAFRGVDSDPDYIQKEILRLFGAFKCRLVGADWGGGFAENDRLRTIIGHDKFIEFFYIPTGRRLVKYDESSGRVNLAREISLSMLFNSVGKHEVKFPAWDSPFQELARHFFNMIIEYGEKSRVARYVRKVGTRDDFVHALNYAQSAAKIHFNEWIV